MTKTITLDLEKKLSWEQIREFIFKITEGKIELSSDVRKANKAARTYLLSLIEQGRPIYGVTTGFGINANRSYRAENTALLQKNLVAYLRTGTGDFLEPAVGRASAFFRLISMTQGYSGVSEPVLNQLLNFLNSGLSPAIPSEGSLGASGDLVPLAYLAANLHGEEKVFDFDNNLITARLGLEKYGLKACTFEAKDGLAIVNGTSVMAAQLFVCLEDFRTLIDLVLVGSSWNLRATHSKTEAFSTLINDRAKFHPGQSKVASCLRQLLKAEAYQPREALGVADLKQERIQERYSLRCIPQILGPLLETCDLVENWVYREILSASDNPILDGKAEEYALGGNFYGGHMSLGADYLKIAAANLCDLIDRQVTLLMDRGAGHDLPDNLSGYRANLAEEDLGDLHHGLKGCHQSLGALTGEIAALATSHSIFSRSAESHNQDKISMGMSAAHSLSRQLGKLFFATSHFLACAAQAIELSDLSELSHPLSREIFELTRSHLKKHTEDRPLGDELTSLAKAYQAYGRKKISFIHKMEDKEC